jgi:lipopolysaccharide/colanic/teichoic acid biosynthesis glycosyltransferase
MRNHQRLAQTWMTAFSLDVMPAGPHITADIYRWRYTQWRADLAPLRFVAPSMRLARRADSAPNQPAHARPAVHRHRNGRRHVLSQELFRSVLTREQQCTQRFEQPHVLLLVSAAKASSRWTEIVDALAFAAGDTAVIGWIENQIAIGAVAPVTGGYDSAAVLRRELVNRLGADQAGALSVRSHVYSHQIALNVDAVGEGRTGAEEPSFRRRTTVYDVIKRAVDIAGSAMLLCILSPLFALVAALVKLTSPGPVLFRQRRIGRMGRPFTMLKFRTMRVDADHALHQQFVTAFIKSSAQLQTADPATIFKLTNDPRVTPIGRLLRKTSIDELPQLWNVVRGEMSLVGPRPPLAYEVEQYRPWHWRRVVDAKPGITGLWQVNGRSRTTFDEMVRLDLRYARASSLWVDIKILLATPKAVISGKGAA